MSSNCPIFFASTKNEWRINAENFIAVDLSYTISIAFNTMCAFAEVLGWVESDDDEYIVPRNIGAPKFIQSRERETLFATLQYAPNDNLLMTLNYLDSQMDVDNQNSNLINFAFGDRAEIIANATKVKNGAILGAIFNFDNIESARNEIKSLTFFGSLKTNLVKVDLN